MTTTIDVGKIMAYEDGELDFDQTVELFQELIDSGVVWRLQGHYGRMAATLIDEGECHYTTPDEGRPDRYTEDVEAARENDWRDEGYDDQ